MCMKLYNHNGNLLEEHNNIPLNGYSNDRRKFDSIIDPSGFLKHFILRYPCSYECYRSYIEILNPANHSVDSRRIEYYPLAHSAAHGNFSICFGKYGLQCKLFNHDFQPYHENATEVDNSDWTITFVSMYNLLGGGVMVVHCSTRYLTECSLRYDVIDANGKKHRGDILYRGYDTGGGSPRHPHPDPQHRPTIFEKDAENGIYCIAMAYSTVKCIKIENF
ncbi:hypothetical protein QAD02_010245 [Eretmocerus hayati]|uniref:Uncharacterized protein n=1 Tax=Eretmocerus hayati TaxID=131215 RepID=A0ACC2NBP4_9HYME|nr:hypothetical protein QAD02_010245 [Eretmocerus hayati]